MSMRMPPKMLPGLRHLFEEFHIVHYGKEGKLMVTAVSWPLLWAVQLATDAQLEAEARVRKFEEMLRLEKDVKLFATLLWS